MASGVEQAAAFVSHDTDTSWLLRTRQEISLAVAYLNDLEDEEFKPLAAQLVDARMAMVTAIDQAKACWDGGARVAEAIDVSHARHAALAARAAGRIESLARAALARLDAAGERRDDLARSALTNVIRYMSQRPLAVRKNTASGARLRTLIAASAAPPMLRITLAGAPPSPAELEHDERERMALLHAMSLDYSRRPPREQLVCLGRQASAFIALLPSIAATKERFSEWVASCRQVRDQAHALAVELADHTLRVGCEELGSALASLDPSVVHGAMVCLHRALDDARHRLAGGWDMKGLPEDEAPKQTAGSNIPPEARAIGLVVDAWEPDVEPGYFTTFLEAIRFIGMEGLLTRPLPHSQRSPDMLAPALATRLVMVAAEKDRAQPTRRVAAVAAALLAFLDSHSGSAVEEPMRSLMSDSNDFDDISVALSACLARGGPMPDPQLLLSQARHSYEPEEATRHEIRSAVRRLRNIVALEARAAEGWSRAAKLLETCDLAGFLRTASDGEVVGAIVGWAGLAYLAQNAGRFNVGRFMTAEDEGPFPGGVTGEVRSLLVARLREAYPILEDEHLRDLAERVADGDLSGTDLVAAMRQALRAPGRRSVTPQIAATSSRMGASDMKSTNARGEQEAQQLANLAMSKHWSDVAQDSPQYEAQMKLFAELVHTWGPEKFKLYYGLREPRTDEERLSRNFMRGQISSDEFGAELKALAERPIDSRMLSDLHDYYVDRLSAFAKFLQSIVDSPTRPAADHEDEATAHITEAMKKSTLFSENMRTVGEFLEEVRVENGLGIARLGAFEGVTAHWATEIMISRSAEMWQRCREMANRSRTDPHYLSAASASSLFEQTWARRLPSPQVVHEQLRVEVTHARVTLKRRLAAEVRQQPAHGQPFVGGGLVAATPTVRVLILASDPKDRGVLRLSEELREIKDQTRRSKAICDFDFVLETAVRPQDVQDALMRHTPHIVHFCGHGNKDGKVVLEGPLGNSKPVEVNGLAKVLKLAAGDGLRAAIFNACSTQLQAEAAASVLECAVGTHGPIDDKSAIVFAGALYRAIAYGKDFARAVESGRAEVAMQGYPDADAFLVLTVGRDASKILLSRSSP